MGHLVVANFPVVAVVEAVHLGVVVLNRPSVLMNNRSHGTGPKTRNRFLPSPIGYHLTSGAPKKHL
ncbi:hypothetical protein E2C01_050103 [Portunus trituberculatus]|uniref:Uncharacterized protein n=1 Tax=Portunus trituberculatus TaxID=210409 RepID=A0A5B7G7D0_PORTR|nr:hypothetical protein [Portunus trituberculatus]